MDAGFDTDAVTPWNNVQNAPQTPRSTGAQERESLTPSAAATEALDAPAIDDGSPTAWPNRDGRPRTASRQIIFSQESLSIADSINPASPLAADASANMGMDSIRVARRETREGNAHGSSADVLSLETDEVLSTGCTTPVVGQTSHPLLSLAEQGSSSSTALPPLGSIATSSDRTSMRPLTVRSPCFMSCCIILSTCAYTYPVLLSRTSGLCTVNG